MKQQIENLLHEAMKNGDKLKVNVYRSLISDIQVSEKSGKNIDPIQIISKSLKKRLEAASLFEKANRLDLMDNELKESTIINELLPKEPTDEEINDYISECMGNVSTKLGDIIKYVKTNCPTVDGKKISSMVMERLK